jgi:hypothetical protein
MELPSSLLGEYLSDHLTWYSVWKELQLQTRFAICHTVFPRSSCARSPVLAIVSLASEQLWSIFGMPSEEPHELEELNHL